MKMRPTYQRTVGRHDTQHKGPAYPLAIVLRGPGLTKACHTHTSAGGNARCLKKKKKKKVATRAAERYVVGRQQTVWLLRVYCT